jgi:NAD(P)-dependent dehydrogenase (short-subunit alcohol dehydrogenase family)
MQVVIITGVAQGMGREVALRLAARGDAVAGFDVDAAGVESLRAELDAKGSESFLTTLDVCDRPGILAFRDEVLRRWGRADVVLSNVGIGFFGPFEEVDLDKANRCLEINVIGTAAILQGFLPSMRERRAGKLVAVSSLVGQIPFPFESIYSASKFAVEGLVLSLRYEVERSPYRERVRRFIARDEELIQTALDPVAAAEQILRVVTSPKPRLHNALDAKSRFFLALNRFLPERIRDAILLRQMDIR